MKTAMVPIERIEVGARLRATNEQHIRHLMGSISDVGLLHAIVVGEPQAGRYPLVGGRHRLEACRRLGHETIAAHIAPMSELQRQLAECDENLVSTKLSSADWARFMAKRKAVWVAMHPNGPGAGREKQVGPIMGQSFIGEVMAKTGRSRTVVARDLNFGTIILDEVLETIRLTDFDRKTELDRIKRMTPDEQRHFAALVRDRQLIEARQMVDHWRYSVVVQLPGNCDAEVRKQLNRLDDAWKAASDEARARFLRRLEKRGVKVAT